MAIRLLFPFFIITITAVILVASQGAGGRGGSGIGDRGNIYGSGSSGSGNGVRGNSNGSGGSSGNSNSGGGDTGGKIHCESAMCHRVTTIMIIAIVGISSLVMLFACYKFALQGQKNTVTVQHVPINQDFVNVAPRCHTNETEHVFIFKSGTWVSRYHQYGKWHDQNRLALSFDRRTYEVRGKGNDDVGVFNIFGVYSTETQHLNLIKTYQYDKGDPQENVGHNVVIQLTWNRNNRQFEGIWYVQTNQYHGDNKFELKFETSEQLFMI